MNTGWVVVDVLHALMSLKKRRVSRSRYKKCESNRMPRGRYVDEGFPRLHVVSNGHCQKLRSKVQGQQQLVHREMIKWSSSQYSVKDHIYIYEN